MLYVLVATSDHSGRQRLHHILMGVAAARYTAKMFLYFLFRCLLCHNMLRENLWEYDPSMEGSRVSAINSLGGLIVKQVWQARLLETDTQYILTQMMIKNAMHVHSYFVAVALAEVVILWVHHQKLLFWFYHMNMTRWRAISFGRG